MFRASFLALCVLAPPVTAQGDQPPARKPAGAASDPDRPRFTAFPDVKVPVLLSEALYLIPALPALPTDAPALMKTRHAQAREGLLYLALMSEVIRRGSWDNRFFFDTLLLTNDVFVVAAEAEDVPADRVPWYELRVRKLKELERLLEDRAHFSSGTLSPHICVARFYRLQAEYDLLALKERVARAGGGPGRALKMQKNEDLFRENGFSPDGSPRNRVIEGELVLEPQAPTAFPNLIARTSERKTVTNPDGTTDIVFEEKGVVPLPRLPVLSPGASALRKLHHERVLEGFGYSQTASPTGRPLFDGPTPDLLHYFRSTTNTYRAAADLETNLIDRVPWYEARVRALKLGERIVYIRVLNGSDPPQKLVLLRFHRLQTEVDLLRLKGEAERANPATGPAPVREESAIRQEWNLNEKPRPHYTLFPELKPITIEWVDVKDAEGMTQRVAREKDAVPLPPLPAVGADAPLARKIRYEQVREGLVYLDLMREVTKIGAWDKRFFNEYGHMAMEVYRAAAELEDAPAKRVPRYEARVRTLKSIERFTDIRVQNGSDPPENLNDIRVRRLRAEAELLILKATAEVAPPTPVLVVCPPPMCVKPRGGLLARVFRCR